MLEIFFTMCQSAGSIGPGGKPLSMCGHVQVCAGMCKIYTCGSNVV